MAREVLVGTRKGLFFIRDGRLSGPELTGWSIFHAIRDPRDGALYVASNNWVYGGVVHRSTDSGKTWERSEKIEVEGYDVGEVWHVEPGHESEPATLFLGAAPGLLLRSDDSGTTWRAVDVLVTHPTREKWAPGAGGMCCHSVQIDPGSARRMLAGISAAGAFRTVDGGETWTPVNSNVAADFLPEKYPEVGQCVHKLLLHPAKPERLWQQNHCGVYRSDDFGDTWERLDGNGLPSGFGFPIMLDPAEPDVAFVIPEEGAENRVTSNGRLSATTVSVPCSIPVGTALKPAASTRRITSGGNAVVAMSMSPIGSPSSAFLTAPPTTRASSPSRSSTARRSVSGLSVSHAASRRRGAAGTWSEVTWSEVTWSEVTWSAPAPAPRPRHVRACRSTVAASRRTGPAPRSCRS